MTEDVVHGFRSATSVVAFCGVVVRPADGPRPRTEATGDVSNLSGVCPDCAAIYTRQNGLTR